MTYIDKDCLYGGQYNRIEAIQPVPPTTASTTGTDYGRGTTRSDNSPGNAGGLAFVQDQTSEQDGNITPVQPVPPAPVLASEEGDQLTPVQPVPPAPVLASEEDDQLTPVQPLPLGPVFASEEENKQTAVQSKEDMSRLQAWRR